MRAWNSTLERRTPLAARTPLQPGKGPQRRTPMPGRAAVPGEGRKAATRRTGAATGPSLEVRRLVLERDGHACVCCGMSIAGQPYSLQHRKRRSQGGTNDPSNLITVLGTGTTGCHERIDSRRSPEDEDKGYTVRSWQDPAGVPVTLFGGAGGTFYLWDDGTYHAEGPQEAAA